MEKRIIEINGVKFEVDMRNAKRVDNFKVGDTIKVLVKKYSETYESHPGVIIGFDEFEQLPTIRVAYLDLGYGESHLKFTHINKNSKDVEICAADPTEIPFERDRVIELLDREIVKSEEAVRTAKAKKEFFLRSFGAYFKNSV